MPKIKHVLRWIWVYSIPIGLLGVAASLGFFMSGIWLTVLLLSDIPMIIAWYFIMVILCLMCMLLTAACVQALVKLVKLFRGRYM